MAKRVKPTTGNIDFQGLPIRIEYSPGDRRYYRDNKFVTMKAAYGEVKKTRGVDGDPVDVYVGPHLGSKKVFVIKQMKVGDFSTFDEEKCMLGTNSAEEAKALYLAHYSDPKFFGGIKELTMDDFKERLETRGSVGEKLSMRMGSVIVRYCDQVKGAPNMKIATRSKEREYGQQGARLGSSLGVLGGLALSHHANPKLTGGPARLIAPILASGIGGMALGSRIGKRYGKQEGEGKPSTFNRDVAVLGGSAVLGALAAHHGRGPLVGFKEKAKQIGSIVRDHNRINDLLQKGGLPEEVQDQLHRSRGNLKSMIGVMKRTPAPAFAGKVDVAAENKLRGLGAAGGGALGLYGIRAMDKSKEAAEDRHTRISDHIDEAGLGILAAPYVAKGIGKHLAHRPGALGAIGRGAEAVAKHMHDHNRYEVAGLALVAPGVTHRLARGVERVTPAQSTKVAFISTLKRVAAPVIQKARGMLPGTTKATTEAAQTPGKLFTAKNIGKATLAGGAGLGVYGAAKGIGAAAHAVSHESGVAPPPNYLGPRLF